MTSTRTILSHARAFQPQHSTSVMGTLLPGVAYRRSPPRKPEFLMFPPPWEGEAPAEPQTEPLAEPQTQPPAACQSTTGPCPQLIAIRNYPAKQQRRSLSIG